MQEKEALIDIFDEDGKNIGHKFRNEVNERIDILKVVAIVLVDDANKVFTAKASGGHWPGKWGSSAGGVVRHDEALADAAKRTLKRELKLTENLEWLGENYYNFDGVRRFMSVFVGRTKAEPKLNPEDAEEGKWVTIQEAAQLDTMPTFNIALEIVEDPIK